MEGRNRRSRLSSPPGAHRILPRPTIHEGGGFALKRVERRPERIDIDMVAERGCCSFFLCLAASSNEAQRMGHASPARARCVLADPRSPGPRPGFHRSATGRPALFVGFVAYYGRSPTIWVVHQRYGSSPSRYGPSDPNTGLWPDPEISRFPPQERPVHARSQTTPGPTGARNTRPADLHSVE